MPDYLNHLQKLLLKVIGHVWSTIYAVDRLALGQAPNLAESRLIDTAELLEQTAQALRAFAPEHRRPANRGDAPLPENGASEKPDTDKAGGARLCPICTNPLEDDGFCMLCGKTPRTTPTPGG